MRRGIFQRAAVTIVLMGSLLAPNGICQQQAHKTAHDCCAPASESNQTAQTDCCKASAPLPAVIVAPSLSGPAQLSVVQVFLSSDELSSPRELPAMAVIPPLSPPAGAF